MAQLWHCPLIYWTRDTHITVYPEDSPGSPWNLQEYLYKAKPALPGKEQGTLGAIPMPLQLVLRWRHVGTSHAPDPDAYVVDQEPQLCPQVTALPHEIFSPTPQTVQYSSSRLLPPVPLVRC